MISKQVAGNVVSHVMHANERTNEDAMLQYILEFRLQNPLFTTDAVFCMVQTNSLQTQNSSEKASIIPEEVFPVLWKKVREGE